MLPFAPLIGQPRAVELLTQAVMQQRVAPAYLFAGSNGVGRGLAALCFVECLLSQGRLKPQALNAQELRLLQNRLRQKNHPDLLWVEPTFLHQGKRLTTAEAIAADVKRKTPPVIRLEQVREISQFLSRSPLEAPRSVVIIEQAETMAEAAANALLKTLEEPGQATLILIAQGTETLLPTLVSRCQRIPFFRLSGEAMNEVLQHAGYAEILEQPQILQLAQGSPGAAISHWQKLQEIPAELLAQVSQPARSQREALSLARQIQQALELEAQLWLIDFLQHQYWQQLTSSTCVSPASALTLLQPLEQAREYLLQNVNPRLVWEVTLMKLVREL
ncbi:MAG: DNA polymerase III subunit delta' [Leptolyngbyaceae cyanobacterium bins.349]|nr:DNA polymerase III subunit delta' [Leptolyngbyaceae cyanobacterium bins.349]